MKELARDRGIQILRGISNSYKPILFLKYMKQQYVITAFNKLGDSSKRTHYRIINVRDENPDNVEDLKKKEKNRELDILYFGFNEKDAYARRKGLSPAMVSEDERILFYEF